jgi:NAD(P)-dependent dehydrogenase (short-subunit alcohol dehydrogenase family)
MQQTALIVGAGSGLSAALARRLAAPQTRLVLAARDIGKLSALRAETGALSIACDAAEVTQVDDLFARIDAECPPLSTVIYNPSFRSRGPLTDLRREDVLKTLMVTAYGGFLVGQHAARRMLAGGRGTILFTGASASTKGYPQSAPFAMGKFALRGLAQSMARELAPQNIHVAHVVIDGGIRSAQRPESGPHSDTLLDPAAIADAYMFLLQQPRSAWTWEIELRPWVERF